jgi:hypothetical protein
VHREYNYKRALFGQVCIFILAIVAWIALTSSLFGRNEFPRRSSDRVARPATHAISCTSHAHFSGLVVFFARNDGPGARLFFSIAVSWIAYQRLGTRVALLCARVCGFNLSSLCV